MGAAGSCGRNDYEEQIVTDVDPNIPGVDCGNAESYTNNEIREIKINDKFTVLVSEFEGKFYAYGSKCPHYGAPLAKGALVDGMVRCPWHGACFDIRSGDIEDYPGSESIPTYQVSRGKKGELMVYPSHIGAYRVQRPMSKVKNRSHLFAVIGGGPTSIIFAQTLRENNYEGRILIISKETHLPYDRTKLSKAIGSTWEDIKIKDEKWFSDAQVEIMLNANCTNVDLMKRILTVEGRAEKIPFHQLLIATGCRPRIPLPNKIGVEGIGLKNVFALYTLKDIAKIKEKTANKEVVIMGTGFIAMELISSLSPQCKTLKLISRNKRPYGVVLGEMIGRLIQQQVIRKYKNVKFIGCDTIKKIEGDDNDEVVKVITLKKRELPCQVVIYAIGGVPNTEIFQKPEIVPPKPRRQGQQPPLDILPNGFIPVNEHMQTNVRDVWAAGDICRFPLSCSVVGYAQIGHWGMAQKMGKIAALSAVGLQNTIVTTVPFFWTYVAGITLRYTGFGENYNQTVIFGDLQSLKFCVLFKRDFVTLAACTCNCDPIAAKLCFDLQDRIGFDGSYPSYITDMFPRPPVIGETCNGLRFNTEELVNEYDAACHRVRHTWVKRQVKVYDDNIYKDREFHVVPIKSPLEKKEKVMFGRKRDEVNTHSYYKNTHRSFIEDDFKVKPKQSFYY